MALGCFREIRKSPLDRQMRIISIDHPNRGSRSMLAVQPHAHDPSHSTHHTAEPPSAVDAVALDSTPLLKGPPEMLLPHGNECYRLRHNHGSAHVCTHVTNEQPVR